MSATRKPPRGPAAGRRPLLAALLTGLAMALVLAACGGSGGTTTTESTPQAAPESQGQEAAATSGEIVTAPAFTTSELEAVPGDNWITNGGNLTNGRFSSLDEINTENVKELKGEWMTKIGQNATAAKFSAEGQALEYEGTIYIPDGADDVYAIDASTGEILWTYEPHIPADPLGEVVCCGWDNRGVALAEGMVFLSQLNGIQVALDQKTGKVVWMTPIVEPRSGYSMTSAPLYYEGRLYVGGSGGEYGVRGRLTALDAKTGKILWRFYTTPSPQEIGGDTWPDDGSYKNGGAAVWNTPSVDPKLNEIYFSTSNAGPWVGTVRPGDNLFTASIVALDADTGKYKWHYQEVHHDIWDFDAPSPTVLFDGEMDGRQRAAIGQPSKTGWVYLLDRKTGKPIYPIPEVKVPQDPQQKTSPTQPMPTMEPFSPITLGSEALANAKEAVAADKPKPKVVAGPIFTPMSTDPTTLTMAPNAAVGGDNWPPSSYYPEANMYFVCSQSGATGLIVPPHPAKFVEGQSYVGSDTVVGSGFDTEGFITAYDLSTGKIAWQNKIKGESCYSGAVTTAGGLLFVGHNDGNLVAYDAKTGKELWHWQTGAAANSTVTPFEDEGEEKIALYAGGNSLAATAHGENFWVFSLKGTMEEAKGLEAEEEGTLHAGETAEAEGGGEEGGAPNAEAGKEVFAEECSVCHGADGLGGNGGPDLTTQPKAKEQKGAEEQVANGGGGMPAFKGLLSAEEIANVAAFVVEDIVGGK
ncbi:MAG TPA: PQQ-binding-like beta-propeller repeat protein [Solirubrobacterales bacterium]|nr:PQQ-binding-like beta-propeller repeat protein [Solirubrobacterales bacterium]